METALKREIREETGIEVSVGPLVGFGESFFYWEDSDQAYHHLAFYYLCTPETMEVCGRGEIDDGEADNPHWAEIESLRAEDFQCHGDLVLDILARLENEIPSLTPGRWDCFGTEVPKQSTEAGMDDLIDCDAFLGGTKWVPRDQLQFRPSVYAVIVHQDRLLVVDVPRTGKWALPGGAIEPGERLESALRREIREEVGIEVTVGVLAGVRDGFFYYEPLDHAFHTIVCYYRGTPATFKLPEERQIQDTETRRPHWVEIPGLRAEDFQFHGDLILELLAHLGSESPSPVVLGRPETLEEI